MLLMGHPQVEPLVETREGVERVIGRVLDLRTTKLGRTLIQVYDERSGLSRHIALVGFVEKDGWFRSYLLDAGLKSGTVLELQSSGIEQGPLLEEAAHEMFERLNGVVTAEQERGVL